MIKQKISISLLISALYFQPMYKISYIDLVTLIVHLPCPCGAVSCSSPYQILNKRWRKHCIGWFQLLQTQPS